jgi:hypothetical protein
MIEDLKLSIVSDVLDGTTAVDDQIRELMTHASKKLSETLAAIENALWV